MGASVKRVLPRVLRARRGQTTVEYLMTTVTLVMVFASMYGFLHGQLKKMFEAAGVRILTSYYLR
jgi:Flp pilus assembly pilin Flp